MVGLLFIGLVYFSLHFLGARLFQVQGLGAFDWKLSPRALESTRASRFGTRAMGVLGSYVVLAVILASMAGERQQPTTVLERVEAGLPAEREGLAPGDRVLAIDGVDTPDWEAVVNAIRDAASASRPLKVRFERQGESREVELVTDAQGRIGVGPRMERVAPSFDLVQTIVRPASILPTFMVGIARRLAEGDIETPIVMRVGPFEMKDRAGGWAKVPRLFSGLLVLEGSLWWWFVALFATISAIVGERGAARSKAVLAAAVAAPPAPL